jgi:phage terminase large subunit
LDILIPTIRKEGSELWFSFNPRSPADPVYQKFFVATPADCWICRTNYFDNPYNSTVLLTEAEESKRSNPELYRHIWLGELLSLDSLRMVKQYHVDTGIAVMDNWKTVIGIDIAREGGDKTVICVRR